MTTQYAYNTVTEAIAGLRGRGYDIDYNLTENCLTCNDNKQHYPEDFEITEIYRFEGDSDPADEAVVYAIASRIGGKGVLVNGYGMYSEAMTDEMLKKLTIHY